MQFKQKNYTLFHDNSLSLKEQEVLLDFVSQSRTYVTYYPMIVFMLGTAVRCGETIGLTWNDVDFKNKEVHINHQLLYKKIDKSYGFYADIPKTDSGIRIIPMSRDVYRALLEQRENQLSRGWQTNIKIGEYSDFVFSTKNKRPMMPSAVNEVLTPKYCNILWDTLV